MNERPEPTRPEKVTAEDCVQALKNIGLPVTAAALAGYMGTTSRAVATALRKPMRDGRVTAKFSKKTGICTWRFKRMRKGGAA